MTFDIYELIDKGFTTLVAVAFIYTVFQIGKLVTKYIPSLLTLFKEFVDVWKNFTNAMEDNAKAISKNTEMTDINHKHSEIVLKELQGVNNKFNQHDDNALAIKSKVNELLEILKNKDDEEEVLKLLKQIICKLEDE